MELDLFGFKIRVEILILIVLVYWVLWGHLLCSCSKIGMMEGLAMMTGGTNTAVHLMQHGVVGNEGFVGANTNYGQSAPNNAAPVNTSSWFTPNLTYKAGTKGGKGVQDILNRKEQPIPLPEGEMLMFANTPFTPECCGNSGAYSNSSGCACVTQKQYRYLQNRGGNNVPYSEY